MNRGPRQTLIFIIAASVFAVAAVFVRPYLSSGMLAAAVIAVALVLGTLLVTTGYSVLFGAPYLPTSASTAAEMLRLAGLKPGEKLADLGSGDGRLLIAAARAGAEAEGWEINPALWLLSLWNIHRAGVGALVRLGSYWHDRVDADVVTLFLIRTQMKRMRRKLLAELKPGARVVSYIFEFPDWPKAGETERGAKLYVVPDKNGA